jgi:hypothetical protein
MNVPMFILGNGLSIALSSEFSMKKITKQFIKRLADEDRRFLESISNEEDILNFDDFEENFTKIEAAYESLLRYNSFIKSEAGQEFLNKFSLNNPELDKHEFIISRIYNKYITYILELIHGNVHKDAIKEKLSDFVYKFITLLDEADNSYIFTLNYDLLVETILLDYIGTDMFTDFCNPAGKLKEINIEKYDFNPRRNEEWFPETNRNIELHHLHGSLSLFYNVKSDRVIKLVSSDIGIENIYQRIAENQLDLIPAIITGGGKSQKIVQYPFEFYYRSAKDLCDSGTPTSLYLIGYSFRDEHINELIKRWMRNVEDYTKGLIIIDYKKSEDEKEEFKKHVRNKIKKKPAIPDSCFIFDGVNAIQSTEGTRKSKKHD